MILQHFPIAPMLIALLIPLFFTYLKQKQHLKKIATISIVSILIVLLYPLVNSLNSILSNSIGYFIGKLIVFTILPAIAIIYLEKSNIIITLFQLGIRTNKLLLSILLGIGVLALTLSISLFFFTRTNINIQPIQLLFLFLDAFNEEFYFRGVLLLYLWRITNIKIAYSTATIAFILAHPQYLTLNTISWQLLTTALQGSLLGLVTYKTKNIIGPWISHGLNRILFVLLKALL